MKNGNYLLKACLMLSLLAGCAVVQPPTNSKTESSQVASGSVSEPDSHPAIIEPGDGHGQITGTVPVETLPKPVMSINRAVVALLDRAQLENAGGKRDAAGAALERALRIEPRNPWLWHELARLRLAQGQYAQAITLAKKSNSFAAGQRRVLAENWQVIGNAQIAQGDTAAAELAHRTAKELLQ